MFMDDVEKIVDMTITCKETGGKYDLNDVENEIKELSFMGFN